jgi:hypothetical protein
MEMRNAFIEVRDSTTRTPGYEPSILISTAIHLLFCSVFAPAALPAPPPTSVPAADEWPALRTVTASEISLARGIDISPSAGEPAVRDFEKIKEQGYSFVIVAGWGGVNPNHHASVQLSGARSAGLLTAGYCYLNFASPLDGGHQVREALTAFGTERESLGFLAIDIETGAGNQLSPGLRKEPPDSTAQQLAVVRITEAVEQAQRLGLSAVIYTKQDDWQRITGDTQQFKSLPLWHPKTIGGDDINQPVLANPGCTFGGWTARVGKQYVLDTFLNDPPIQVDLNVFDLNTFSTGRPNDRETADFRIVAAD